MVSARQQPRAARAAANRHPCVCRASLRAGGVRLQGKPAGLPPRSQAGRAGVLEQLQASLSGQFGDDGAGFRCLPGGQRHGVPGLKEGGPTRPIEPWLPAQPHRCPLPGW